ncbi:MAG: hypothetical protein H0U89_01300 [Acidimicrobiia bacterium]|nr:hypothetical protein [Acidimicrobiia bacterium]
MKRLLAVLAAAAMVGGSLYLRYGDDGDEESGRADGGGEGPPQLVCDPLFEEVCDGADAEVTIEDAAATVDRLLGGDRVPDAWLAPGPWPAIVDALGTPGVPSRFDEVAPLARSGLVAVGRADLEGCGWRCFGSRVGDDDLELGWTGPATGLGLVTVGAVSSGFFRGEPFATNDLSGEFIGYLSRFADQARQARAPVQDVIVTNGSAFDVAVSPEAEAEPLVEARRGTRVGLLYPEPVVTVEAVLAGRDTDLTDSLRADLLDRGWERPSEDPTGLPSAGVLAALLGRVR